MVKKQTDYERLESLIQKQSDEIKTLLNDVKWWVGFCAFILFMLGIASL